VIWDLIVVPFAGWIAGAVGAVVLLTGAWWSGRRSGAVRAKNKGLRDQVDAHEVRDEVENRIARDNDARQRLRERWERQE